MMRSFRLKAQRFAAMRRDHGLAVTVRHGCARILQRGIWLVEDRIVWGHVADSTRKTVAVADMEIKSSNRDFAYHYEATPTPTLVMWFIRRILPKDRSAWSFIDVGAGKGRAVAAAAKQGFHNVLGIELAGDLCTEANRLLADLDLTNGGRVRVEEADATQFQIPSGPCLFYLFNPFKEEVVIHFLDHVFESYVRDPRPIRFVYLHPLHQYVFDRRPELKRVIPSSTVTSIFSLLSLWPVSVFEIAPDPCRTLMRA